MTLKWSSKDADSPHYGHDACVWAYRHEMLEVIRKTRSAKRLLEVMITRHPSPDWQDDYSSDAYLWDTALSRAHDRFLNAPETAELKERARLEANRGWSPFQP